MLLRGGRVYAPNRPGTTALAVTDGRISWLGGDGDPAPPADRVVQLEGALVTPGFVDAHVHCTDAGLALSGLDLGAATGVADFLRRIERHLAAHPDGVLWGHGWDETRWPENRAPTRAEIDALAGNRPVYLARVDVHSALVSSALVAAVPGAADLPGYHPERPVSQAANNALRQAARSLLSGGQRQRAQVAFLADAAAHGIVQVHECAAADLVARSELAALLAIDGPVKVVAYLAQAVTDPAEAADLVRRAGVRGLAGDLSVDGSIGSRTASLCAPYADDPSTSGVRYLTLETITDHLVACTRAGVQAGFHAIGDDAVGAVAEAVRLAADRLGTDADGRDGLRRLAACRHRVEHAEMPSSQDIATFAASGMVASVQPLFDGFWGGGDGMYVQRLGRERAEPMNPFAAFAAAGVRLAFGSDAPVTPSRPWQQIRAAVQHRTGGSGISAGAALTAHTAGGRFAGGAADPLAGTIAVGAPADLAVFAVDTGDPDAPADRPLPDLTPGGALPRCLATIVDGRVAFADPPQFRR